MSRTQYGAAVLTFPGAERARRERTLRVAADAARLLDAAVDEGNVTLVEHIFAALGALRSGDALQHLDAVVVDEAPVMKLVAE